MIIAVLLLAYLVYYFTNNGFNVTLDIVNTIFLMLGIVCHKTPIAYVSAITDAAKGSAGIILQFPSPLPALSVTSSYPFPQRLPSRCSHSCPQVS